MSLCKEAGLLRLKPVSGTRKIFTLEIAHFRAFSVAKEAAVTGYVPHLLPNTIPAMCV